MERWADALAARRRKVSRLGIGRSEEIFAATLIGLAFFVGVVRPGNGVAVHLLIVLWAGLAGTMIPQILTAHRVATGARAEHKRRTVEAAMRHDIASALLMIESGVNAMRHMDRERQSDRLEVIAQAVETEIRRIRRLSSMQGSTSPHASISDTILPLVELHVANGQQISMRLESGPEVLIHPDDLARAFANLLDNCARHAPGARVAVVGIDAGDHYEILVRDEGPGIRVDLRDSACELGVSTRANGGTGLYSARTMIERSGGRLDVLATNAGTHIRLTIPVARPKGQSGTTLEMRRASSGVG